MPLEFPILILLIVYSGLFFYYRYWWTQSGNIKPDLGAVAKTRFSIIIPARNEASNIGVCLSSIQQLNYPSELFEVFVVDDHSEDNTAAIATTYPFVKLISLADHVKSPVVMIYSPAL